MIYAELAGGLGNQMFIYAFARALGLRCNEPVTLLDRQDWKDGAPAHTVCALNDLSISPDVQILADPGFAKAHLPRQNTAKALMIKYEQRRGLMALDWQPFETRCAPALNALGLHFATDGYTPVHRGRARDFLAWGYFQSARYFDDFVDEIPENEILQVCTPAYYARAAAAVKAAHPDATLFVFSDDVDWAKQNLNTADLPAVFAPRGSAVGDMALMEQCRGFVLSNSTYSWWAQYLAKTSDKLVLAPEKWYAHTKKSALYLPDWQLIETD